MEYMGYDTMMKLVKSDIDATFSETEMDFEHIMVLIDTISPDTPVHMAIKITFDVLAEFSLIQSGKKNHW